MKKATLLFLALATGVLSVSAQQRRTCGTRQHYLDALAQDPSLTQRRALLEQQMQQWIAAGNVQRINGGGTVLVTVPVVVHVLWNSTVPSQNITDAQVLSQIDVLNKDYGLRNADTTLVPARFKPLVADVQFQFCMATVDPNGNPTTGIERRSVTITRIGNGSRYYNYAQGGLTAWDHTRYLNFWICDIDGGNTLGFSYLPGTTGASDDGVVIDYNYWGTIGTVAAPFNKGRTATHEVGHWFNLEHIWADEPNCAADDYVSDTPQQKGENYGCPTYPQGPNASAGGGCCVSTDVSSMYMNYMDYTDDACMFMFTPGQASRMQAALNISRPGLLTATGCLINSVGQTINPFRASIAPNPAAGEFEFSVSQAAANYQLVVTDLQGRVVLEKNYSFGEALRFDIAAEADGVYIAKISAANDVAFARIVKQ